MDLQQFQERLLAGFSAAGDATVAKVNEVTAHGEARMSASDLSIEELNKNITQLASANGILQGISMCLDVFGALVKEMSADPESEPLAPAVQAFIDGNRRNILPFKRKKP